MMSSPIIAGIAKRCEQDAQFSARLADGLQLHTRTLSNLFPALAGSWPASQTSSGPDAYGTQRAEQALEALFLALARETGGVALLFDNPEHVDPLTRAVLESLADSSGQQQAGHLLCVVTQQSTDSPLSEAGSAALHLGPLSDAAAASGIGRRPAFGIRQTNHRRRRRRQPGAGFGDPRPDDRKRNRPPQRPGLAGFGLAGGSAARRRVDR